MSARLTAYLKETEDPRETAKAVRWDERMYYGRKDWKIPDVFPPLEGSGPTGNTATSRQGLAHSVGPRAGCAK